MTNKENSIGYLFPGQGAQFVGMGKSICDEYKVASDIFQKANDILGYSIQQICFEGPEEKLTQTLFAQPAIFVTSCAVLGILESNYGSMRPSFCAGLSLGEFTALYAAKSISFEDGLRLVQLRAQAMEQAAKNNPGTMASIMGLNVEQCEAIASESGCEMANLNAPDQIVLSGTLKTVEVACRLAEEKGAKRAIMLKVGGAFHSSLMSEAREALKEGLSKTKISSPNCIFIPNTVAKAVSDPIEIKSLLAQQLTSSVRWVETMARAKESGISQFYEIGPGKVLKGLARRCDRDLKVDSLGESEDFSLLENNLSTSL
jgi:[acyl-carrier-protein] S-malonyltransferase